MTAEMTAENPWTLKMVVPMEPGIVCKDINRMLPFYVGVLGFKFVSDAETLPQLSKRFGATPYGYRIVRLQTFYGERIKLVQPKQHAPNPNPAPEWLFERHGFAYLTFVIPDIKEVINRLKEHRVKLISESAIEVREGVLALFSVDPEGNFLEFVEYADVASYRPDLFK
jgi:lactoylglutathione lyase